MGAELYRDHDVDDVNRTLMNNICLYKGEPVTVLRTEEHRIHVAYLKDLFLVETIDYRVKDFRYYSPPLGYLNHRGRAVYLVRLESSSGHALDARSIGFIPEDACPFLRERDNWFKSKEMRQCIIGEHPSFKEAYDRVLCGDAESIAFHRHYALESRSKGRIIIKKRGEEEVGIIKNNRIVLFDTRKSKVINEAVKDTDFNVDNI